LSNLKTDDGRNAPRKELQLLQLQSFSVWTPTWKIQSHHFKNYAARCSVCE